MVSASYFGWAFTSKHPILPNGGPHLPYAEEALYQFDLPRTFSACKAVALGDALEDCREVALESGSCVGATIEMWWLGMGISRTFSPAQMKS